MLRRPPISTLFPYTTLFRSTSEQGVAAIQVAPASLNHPHFWIGKKMDRALEQVRLRDKVRVKDAEKFAISRIQADGDRKSTRLNSSHLVISYAVFCLKKKKK